MSEYAEKALIREERWVPVTESGDRWAGRSRESALRDLADWPAGGRYLDGDPYDGVTHIECEVRYVTEWCVTEPARTTTRVPAREAHTEGADARRPQVEAGETGAGHGDAE